MFSETDLLPISALQHLAFCQRQWGLIHLEAYWAENRLTVEGRHLHERVDTPGVQSRGDVRIVRGLRIHSLRLGLVGRADVVEFRRTPDRPSSGRGGASTKVGQSLGICLARARGLWRPFPVEYKRGKAKRDDCDRVQLCAQAICLEEMLRTLVPAGALFYGRTRRRLDVDFDTRLRNETERLSARMHELFHAGVTPQARYDPKRCDRCSLLDRCLPKTTGAPMDIDHYLATTLKL